MEFLSSTKILDNKTAEEKKGAKHEHTCIISYYQAKGVVFLFRLPPDSLTLSPGLRISDRIWEVLWDVHSEQLYFHHT